MLRSTRPVVAGIAIALTVAGCAGAVAPASSPPPPTATPATPANTPVPTATAVASSPTPSAAVRLTVDNLDKAIVPGAYRVAGPFGNAFSLAFPSEWTLKSLAKGDVQFVNSAKGDNEVAWLVVDQVENVFADPCHATGPSDPPVAKSVDGVVGALTRMKGYQAGPITEVTVGAHAGKALELTNAIDTATADCAGGPMLPMWTFAGGGASGTNGGATEQLWVIDVHGTPVIIDGETFHGTPAGSKQEIRTILSSMAFD